MTKTKKKAVANKIISWVCAVILLIIVGIFLSMTYSIATKGYATLFKYSLHLVVTDSMTPEIKINDLVVAKEVPREDIKIGTDIVFISKDPVLKGAQVVHRVVGINGDGSFVTQGIKPGAGVDGYSATEIVGKVVRVDANAGKMFVFLVKYRQYIFFAMLLIIIGVAISEVISIAVTIKTEKAKNKTDGEGDK